MLEYGWIDMSAGIDVLMRDCIICYHWYFLEINLKFHRNVWNGYHNLMQTVISLFNDFSIVSIMEMNIEFIFGI